MKKSHVFIVAAICLAIGAMAGIGLIAKVAAARLFETRVTNSFILFVKELRQTRQLVLLSTTDQFTYRKELSKNLLFIDTNATVQVSVIADINYYIDLDKTDKISIRITDSGRKIEVKVPYPEILYPSLHTNTLKVEVLNRDFLSGLVLRIKRHVEGMKTDISDEVDKQARLSLGNSEICGKIKDSLASLLSDYLAQKRIEAKDISIDFI